MAEVESEAEDNADAALALTEEGEDDAIAESMRDRLDAIDRALHRIDDGTYGRSVRSGSPIPDERLEADPGGGTHHRGGQGRDRQRAPARDRGSTRPLGRAAVLLAVSSGAASRAGRPGSDAHRGVGVRVAAVGDEPLHPGRAGQFDPGRDQLGLAPVISTQQICWLRT